MKVIVAIICIAGLEALALMKGHNGVLLTMSVAAIAGLAGLATKRPKMLRDDN